MKPLVIFSLAYLAYCVFLGIGFGVIDGATNTAPVTTNGVMIDLLSPLAGSVVSNKITLSADASSLAGPIAKVEFYVDGGLIGTVTNKFAKPEQLTVY